MLETIRRFEDDMEKCGYEPPFFLGLNSPNKIPFSAMFRGPFASAIIGNNPHQEKAPPIKGLFGRVMNTYLIEVPEKEMEAIIPKVICANCRWIRRSYLWPLDWQTPRCTHPNTLSMVGETSTCGEVRRSHDCGNNGELWEPKKPFFKTSEKGKAWIASQKK